MARIEQVIHVKGTDGTVRECALFDSASDIPSGTSSYLAAWEFGLNGAAIYGAVLDVPDGQSVDLNSDDGWLQSENGTELVFRYDAVVSKRETIGHAARLLTTPYFMRPLVESLEFGADGGDIYFDDILSTNGTISDYSCDCDGISVENIGMVKNPIYVVRCAANTGAEDIGFTLTLTFTFADGSTQDITFSGTQAAAEAKESWLTVTPTSATIAAAGGSVEVEVDSSSDWTATTDQTWVDVSPASGAGGVSSGVTVKAIYSERFSGTLLPSRSFVTFTNADGASATLTLYLEY